MTKNQLRQELKKRLSQMSEEQRIVKSKSACQNLISLNQFKQASTIMVFLSFDNEIETAEIILHAWQMGKVVAAPKVLSEKSHMIPIEINSLDKDIVADSLGVPNPTHGTPVPICEIDFVITPGLGFDRDCNRLGRGAGYYDRFFSDKAMRGFKCGLAFSEQLVESVPVTASDVAVDMVVTDEEIIG